MLLSECKILLSFTLLLIILQGMLKAQPETRSADGKIPALPHQKIEKVWDFEGRSDSTTDGWDGQECEIGIASGIAESGRGSLRLKVNFPQPATVKTSFHSSIHKRLCQSIQNPSQANMEWEVNMSDVDAIAYSVFLPKDSPSDTRVLFYVKSKDGLWFQNLYGTPLKVNEWVNIRVDLSENSVDLVPGEHFGRWNRYIAEQIDEIGITVFSYQHYNGFIYLDYIVAYKHVTSNSSIEIMNFRCDSAISKISQKYNSEAAPDTSPDNDNLKVGLYEKYEVSFELNRSFDNPFDPDQIRVDGIFTTPSGKILTVPGFYYQKFTRTLGDDGREILIQDGPACWKIRFAPMEVGTYSYFIKVVTGRTGGSSERRTADRGTEIVTRVRQFTAVPSAISSSEAISSSDKSGGMKYPSSSSRNGFIRVSQKDRRYFEFSNGNFFYPIGHSLHSPVDVRSEKHIGKAPYEVTGTYLYDLLIPKMYENGVNFAEVWMSSWWLGLEWTEKWAFYHGIGRYNLQNAWKLDYVVELAERTGIYLHLVLDNHGKASKWCDPEWSLSPYNKENMECAGGFLDDPEMLFQDSRAKRLYKQKLRYIVARWGYSSHIMGFELWSEIDLVGRTPRFQFGQGKSIKRAWFQEMARYLKSIDPWKHLVTIHYSTDYSKIDPGMASLPELDYVVVDAYKQKGSFYSIIPMVESNYYATSGYNKPTLITEFGGSPWAGSDSELKADLHAGLWTGLMTPHAGPPLFWWYAFIYRENLYFNFRAISRFIQGEDLRGKGLERKIVGIEVTSPSSDSSTNARRYRYRIHGMTLKNRSLAYVWVYDQYAMNYMPKNPKTYSGVSVVVRDVENGDYSVEIWDTYSGEIVKRTFASTNSNRLSIPLPDFQKDIALKIKQRKF